MNQSMLEWESTSFQSKCDGPRTQRGDKPQKSKEKKIKAEPKTCETCGKDWRQKRKQKHTTAVIPPHGQALCLMAIWTKNVDRRDNSPSGDHTTPYTQELFLDAKRRGSQNGRLIRAKTIFPGGHKEKTGRSDIPRFVTTRSLLKTPSVWLPTACVLSPELSR